jgi:hypothetical protein
MLKKAVLSGNPVARSTLAKLRDAYAKELHRVGSTPRRAGCGLERGRPGGEKAWNIAAGYLPKLDGYPPLTAQNIPECSREI